MTSLDFENNFILILLCIFSTFFLFAFFFKKPKNVFDLPPSPPSLPIIGHLHLLFSTSLHKSFQKVSSKYGPLLHLRIFNVRILLVSSASVAYEIFKDHDMSISSHGPIGIDECIVFGSSGFIKAPCGALERSRGLREVEIERFYRDLLDKAVKKESVEIGEEALRVVNVILGKMSLGRSFSEEERVSEFSIEIAALTQKIFLQQVLRKPLEKLRISPPFKKEVMSVSYRFGELLEKIIVRYEEKKDEHEGSEIMDAFLAACGDEDAEYKINRSHIKALLAVSLSSHVWYNISLKIQPSSELLVSFRRIGLHIVTQIRKSTP
ncbi:hypothetical protein F2Q69_00024447 [Brassica cretica]|uniref:Cytochrome P450 n=1 Tax=Brassica cretica TaxID=69181 RepID=A0A8S9QFG2_BRACR|nr:hypothetical protein F2Q69_00024447 [Brassica cretica]